MQALDQKQQQRLKELSALKKKGKLTKEEFAEFKELMSKIKKESKLDRPSSNKSKERTFDPGNDFSWWAKYPDLIRDSASFKSNYIAGRAIDSALVPFIVPGVLEVQLLTCLCPGSEATDPVNVWARSLYLKMFQKYRPATNYSASDLGIAVLAGIEVIKLVATYERIYGVINRYSTLNVNMPLVEAAALGLSASQVNYLQSHLADFRYDLNFLIKKAQRLCIPKDIALVADAISLLGYEYIDHDNPRGQIIMFTSQNYGVYSDTSLTTGGSIQFYGSLIADLFDFTADNMCKALSTSLNALLGSDSIQRIYADLVVWFGQEAMLEFLPFPEDYVVIPVKSDSILHKLHNLECAPSPVDSDGNPTGNAILTSWAHGGLSSADETAVLNGNYHIYQYNDAIVTTGAFKDTNTGTPVTMPSNGIAGKILEGTVNTYGFEGAHVIDGYNIDVTPEFVVEGSLFKYATVPVTSSDLKGRLVTTCCNWIIKQMYLHTNNNSSPEMYSNYNPSSWVNTKAVAGALALVDWAPLSYSLARVGSNLIINKIAGDLDVIIPVSEGNLNRIHTTCILSGLATDLTVQTK